MSSFPATGPSAELIRYTHGSTRIGRTCTPCVVSIFPATRGSAHRPRTARTGCLACMKGNSSASPEEASATGRPASDPLAGLASTSVLPTNDLESPRRGGASDVVTAPAPLASLDRFVHGPGVAIGVREEAEATPRVGLDIRDIHTPPLEEGARRLDVVHVDL